MCLLYRAVYYHVALVQGRQYITIWLLYKAVYYRVAVEQGSIFHMTLEQGRLYTTMCLLNRAVYYHMLLYRAVYYHVNPFIHLGGEEQIWDKFLAQGNYSGQPGTSRSLNKRPT
ncbi:hypothetical protein DPMN_172517 [Dreissena polymorpha]|uniref:Uncharacterized protein n=1 Tax=Dreissena polymorpha TaxID=45954 RepID=A0A9D4E3U2_DREPO|nr:hypothetical protein DPMN_172517 [Dreissena polymorpha]